MLLILLIAILLMLCCATCGGWLLSRRRASPAVVLTGPSTMATDAYPQTFVLLQNEEGRSAFLPVKPPESGDPR